MSKIIAVGNNKGGTSKTTTSISLAGVLARREYEVLLIDADPQANATEGCGYENPDELEVTLATIMQKLIDDEPVEPGDGILHHEEGFDLLPSSIELSGIEVSLVNVMNRERVLKDYLDMVSPFYDFIIIDCIWASGDTNGKNGWRSERIWSVRPVAKPSPPSAPMPYIAATPAVRKHTGKALRLILSDHFDHLALSVTPPIKKDICYD